MSMKYLSTVGLLAAALIACALPARAQEIDATVTVNSDQLPIAARQEVSGFADEMQRYINNTRWTTEPWEGEKIKMTFTVVFSSANNNSYSARLLVGSQRNINKSEKLAVMMKVLDDAWAFNYVRNQPFIQDPTSYDPLTGLIDFYVYLALGLDFDSYGYLAGTSMYQKAWTIGQHAQIRSDVSGWSTQTSPGSYSRYGFVHELTDMRFNPFRKFIYDYHYNGLDLLADNRTAALDSINNHLSELVLAIDKIVEPSVILRVLNDAKNIEYAELFTGYGDQVVWRKLLAIDPGHKSVYETARTK
jgi:hypothetical protein